MAAICLKSGSKPSQWSVMAVGCFWCLFAVLSTFSPLALYSINSFCCSPAQQHKDKNICRLSLELLDTEDTHSEDPVEVEVLLRVINI